MPVLYYLLSPGQVSPSIQPELGVDFDPGTDLAGGVRDLVYQGLANLIGGKPDH